MDEGARETFKIGKRCKVVEYFATIRYIGPVPPSQGNIHLFISTSVTAKHLSGDWVGIEWDDTERGKHSGDHEGIKYFTCRYM